MGDFKQLFLVVVFTNPVIVVPLIVTNTGKAAIEKRITVLAFLIALFAINSLLLDGSICFSCMILLFTSSAPFLARRIIGNLGANHGIVLILAAIGIRPAIFVFNCALCFTLRCNGQASDSDIEFGQAHLK